MHAAIGSKRGNAGGGPSEVSGHKRQNGVGEGLRSDARRGHFCTQLRAQRKTSVAAMNHQDLAPCPDCQVVHSRTIEPAQRQRGGWVRQREDLRLPPQGAQRRLKDQYTRSIRRIHGHYQIGKAVGAVDFASDHGCNRALQRNPLRDGKASMSIAPQEVECVASLLRRCHIPVAIGIKVAGDDEVRSLRHRKRSGPRQEGGRRSIAQRSAVGP